MKLLLPSSNLQASMATALETFRKIYLQQALAQTIRQLDLAVLNGELEKFAPKSELSQLAGLGLRGEFVFPVPSLLQANPKLLGYYRLLLGFSQKEFFNKGGLGRFKSMEEKGVISPRAASEMDDLCNAFAERAVELVQKIGPAQFTLGFLDDLTLLTLGPQLRGSNNTKIGNLANQALFDLIRSLVAPAVSKETPSRIELRNASGRDVVIAFSADPDISISEKLSRASIRNIVAIEIKGGGDQSNIWNRLGEAEKSHQSAKQAGFVEFWTIYNTPVLDLMKAREKSPTTNRFYNLRSLLSAESDELADFQSRLHSLVGISGTKG
ncbi:MAG: XcyI family restriction endonuclease [Terrimicrobiaceae bacterium]